MALALPVGQPAGARLLTAADLTGAEEVSVTVPGALANSIPPDITLDELAIFFKGGDSQVVTLQQFAAEANPLQAALDFLGAVGGTIIVPSKSWIIPARCTSVANLTNLKIAGAGPNSALVFPNGGGGILLTFETPPGNDMNKAQLIVQDVAFMTTFYETMGGAGAGVAIDARWAVAVGSPNLGAQFHNVQCMPQVHDSLGNLGVLWSWWGTCVRLYNARNNFFDNCSMAGCDSGNGDGTGIDLDGGTVGTVINATNISDMGYPIDAHGVCEGITVTGCAMVDNLYQARFDGDKLGDTRSVSTTSTAIGTGSKTFAITPFASLFWAVGYNVVIRDSAAPYDNTMTGTISAYTPGGASVTINVTSSTGSGTHASWGISIEHHISLITMSNNHSSNDLGAVSARWTAFFFYANSQCQKREDHALPYIDIDLLDHNQNGSIHDSTFLGVGSGGTQDGVMLRSDRQNGNFNIHDLYFANRRTAVSIDGDANGTAVHAIYNFGDVTTLVSNTSTNTTNVVFDIVNEGNALAYTLFAANSATPSVLAAEFSYFRTANALPTTYTSFTGGYIGQRWIVAIGDANTTIANNASIALKDSANYSPPSGTVMMFEQAQTGLVHELARNSPQLIGQSLSVLSGPISIHSGLSNGAYWNGWMYFTENLASSDPSVSWSQGLALGWNYSAGLGEVNIVERFGNGIKFQHWNGAVMSDAAVSFGTATASGQVKTPASTAAAASLNAPHGTAPTSPADGDIWTTTAGLFVRINGATVGPLS